MRVHFLLSWFVYGCISFVFNFFNRHLILWFSGMSCVQLCQCYLRTVNFKLIVYTERLISMWNPILVKYLFFFSFCEGVNEQKTPFVFLNVSCSDFTVFCFFFTSFEVHWIQYYIERSTFAVGNLLFSN